jgi:predicted Rossmann fold flavoprotein
MSARQIVVVGGGAAGIFAAITAAEAGADVTVLEKSPEFLAKVRVSGGGRCNVTHACFDPRDLATRYPRGGQELIGPFQRFQPRDTIEWFAARGVKLKTESDGRMFPVTDSSETIIECLIDAAKRAGVQLITNHPVRDVRELFTRCDRLLLATGGCRDGETLASTLGHTIEPPVPSLFTFQLEKPWQIAGVSVGDVEVSAEGIRQRGALLFTHAGLSGPAVLRLSAWGARQLHACHYRFPVRINWLPATNLATALETNRREHPARFIVNTPIVPLPARLWEALVVTAGIEADTRWSRLSRAAQHQLVQQLQRTELQVTGKSTNKEEFVTCGGVRLCEVNFKTMESRVRPGLYLAGELLDIDAITGGFNFQAAWTTGWIAGHAMAA